MKYIYFFLCIAIFPFSNLQAQVQSSKPTEPTKKEKIIYKKSESHQFSGSSLQGKLKKPELSYIYERKNIKDEQILNIPENFNEEIINGAKEL